MPEFTDTELRLLFFAAYYGYYIEHLDQNLLQILMSLINRGFIQGSWDNYEVESPEVMKLITEFVVRETEAKKTI